MTWRLFLTDRRTDVTSAGAPRSPVSRSASAARRPSSNWACRWFRSSRWRSTGWATGCTVFCAVTRTRPTPEAREARTSALAALVELWLAEHSERVRTRFGCGWDLVATVPSTCGRARSPADALVERVPMLAELRLPVLTCGNDRLGHLSAARRGYVLSPALDRRVLRDRTVLVFDDSVTTGSRAQSAAAALRDGGARVTGILAVGRALGAGPPHRARRVRATAGQPTD